MESPFTRQQLVQAMIDLVATNGVLPCYIRPILLRGYGELGVVPFKCPVEAYIANYAWGKYLGARTKAWMSASLPGPGWRPIPCRPWPRPAPIT